MAGMLLEGIKIKPPLALIGGGLTGGIPSMNGMGPFRQYGSGGGGDGSLGDTVASCVWDLDATIADSFDGSSQSFFNLRATPADGSSQSAYDYYRGATGSASSDDPIFTGSAGSASAYFEPDSGDLFSLIGSNTSFLNNLHKTTGGSAATIIMAFRSGATGYYWGTARSSPGSGNNGVYIYKNATQLLIDQFGSSTYGRSSATVVTNGTDQILAVAMDYTNSILKVASNSRTFTSITCNKVTSTTNPTDTMKIYANGQGAGAGGGSQRFYGFYGFNAVLSDSELSSIVTALNTRHSRTYVA